VGIAALSEGSTQEEQLRAVAGSVTVF